MDGGGWGAGCYSISTFVILQAEQLLLPSYFNKDSSCTQFVAVVAYGRFVVNCVLKMIP